MSGTPGRGGAPFCSACARPASKLQVKKDNINHGRWFYKCFGCGQWMGWASDGPAGGAGSPPGQQQQRSASHVGGGMGGPAGGAGSPPGQQQQRSASQVGSPTTPNRGPGIAGPSGSGSPGQAGTSGFRAGPSPGSAAGRAGPAAASPGYAFFFSPGAGKADVKLQLLSQEEFAATFAYSDSIKDVIKGQGGRWVDAGKLWCFPMSKHAQVIEALHAAGFTVEDVSPLAKQLLQQGKEVMNQQQAEQVMLQHLDLPILNALFPFQRDGVNFMVRHNGRVLLADEPGLGKTVQALCAAACFPSGFPLLVICPKLMRHIWSAAVQDWLPHTLAPLPHNLWVLQSGKDIKKAEEQGMPHTKAHVCVASYDMVQKMSADMVQRYQVVICDESHYLKSTSTKRTQFVSKLVKAARHALLLTGTPLLSKPMELFPQIEMLHPRMLGSYREYGNRYCVTAQQPTYRQPYPGEEYMGASNLEELSLVLGRTIMLRRTKAQVAQQLPPKIRQRIPVSIDPAYKRNLDLAKAKLKEVNENLDEVPRLLQQVAVSDVFRATGPAKVRDALEIIGSMLEERPDLKLLLFAHHSNVMDQLQAGLVAANISHVRVDGALTDSQRQAELDRFQNPEDNIKVALLSICAAGVGLTLTEAQVCVFVELFWNPSLLIQAEDRAHRLGQTRTVRIYYLHAAGTADDIVWPLVNKKLQIVSRALGEAGDEDTPGSPTFHLASRRWQAVVRDLADDAAAELAAAGQGAEGQGQGATQGATQGAGPSGRGVRAGAGPSGLGPGAGRGANAGAGARAGLGANAGARAGTLGLGSGAGPSGLGAERQGGAGDSSERTPKRARKSTAESAAATAAATVVKEEGGDSPLISPRRLPQTLQSPNIKREPPEHAQAPPSTSIKREAAVQAQTLPSTSIKREAAVHAQAPPSTSIKREAAEHRRALQSPSIKRGAAEQARMQQSPMVKRELFELLEHPQTLQSPSIKLEAAEQPRALQSPTIKQEAAERPQTLLSPTIKRESAGAASVPMSTPSSSTPIKRAQRRTTPQSYIVLDGDDEGEAGAAGRGGAGRGAGAGGGGSAGGGAGGAGSTAGGTGAKARRQGALGEHASPRAQQAQQAQALRTFVTLDSDSDGW